jgi:hypothetical protein
MLKKEIDVDLFGVAVAYKNLTRSDPQVQFALAQFADAEALLKLSRQRSTGRANR